MNMHGTKLQLVCDKATEMCGCMGLCAGCLPLQAPFPGCCITCLHGPSWSNFSSMSGHWFRDWNLCWLHRKAIWQREDWESLLGYKEGIYMGLTPSMVPSKHSARITRYQQEVMNSKVVTHFLLHNCSSFMLTPHTLGKSIYSASSKLQHCYFLLWSEH